MARDPRLEKPAVELRIFEALAPLIGLDIAPFSIQQTDPPDGYWLPPQVSKIVEKLSDKD